MKPEISVTFLGTGTSQGIPVIGCECPVCRSGDSRDKRLRSSVFIEAGDTKILIDVSPDFRQQMLVNQLSDVDMILLTHEHNDHIIGIDDIRPVNFKHQKNIPIFALSRVLEQVKQKFHYAFEESAYPGAPRLHCIEVMPGTFISHGHSFPDILPLQVFHADLEILGFKMDRLAYITDASKLPLSTLEAMKDLDILILNALQRQPHFSHFNLKEALTIIEKVKPKKTYLTHMSHHLAKHADLIKELPENVLPAYDNLKVFIET